MLSFTFIEKQQNIPNQKEITERKVFSLQSHKKNSLTIVA